MRMVMHRRDELLVCGDDSGLASRSEMGTISVDRVVLLFVDGEAVSVEYVIL